MIYVVAAIITLILLGIIISLLVSYTDYRSFIKDLNDIDDE